MADVACSRMPCRRSVEIRSSSSERRWSVMSMPALIIITISPSSPVRQVHDQAISRRSPAAVSQTASAAIGNCSGRASVISARTASASSGGTSASHGRRPSTSSAARPVSRSQAWLKRRIRPPPSSTRTSAPAVSMPADVRSRSAFSAACARIRAVMSVATPRIARDRAPVVALHGDRQRHGEALAVLAHVGPPAPLGALAARDDEEHLGTGLDAELGRALRHLVRRRGSAPASPRPRPRRRRSRASAPRRR